MAGAELTVVELVAERKGTDVRDVMVVVLDRPRHEEGIRAIRDAGARRPSALCSLSDDELSPAALAARVVLADCVRALVAEGRWRGATLSA